MIGDIDSKDKWAQDRWGKFTASNAYKLLIKAKDGSMFGETAMGYIEERAMEMTSRMWEMPELEETKSLLHGKMYEYPAYEAYIKATRNYSMKYCGTEEPVFLDYEEFKGEAGGSPDIVNITSSNTVDAGAELKCPKNPLYHFRRIKYWKDQWDLQREYVLCYSQIQKLILCTKASIWHFVSYDERQLKPANKIKIIEVFPDKKFQDNYTVRLAMGIKKKYEILEGYGS